MNKQDPAAHKKRKEEKEKNKYIMTKQDLFQECKTVYMLGKQL